MLASIPLVAILVVTVLTMIPLGSAGRARAELETRYGDPSEFTPSADGAIAADRIRVFLEVRRELEETCDTFRAMLIPMDRLDEISRGPDRTAAASRYRAARLCSPVATCA